MQYRTWYLVRHGETEWNASSRMQGQLDSRLTRRGREQAFSSAQLLARLGVDIAFASPLGRVRETVAIIQAELPLVQAELSLQVTFDDRLKEWSAGDWSGELHAEIPRRWPAEWAAWDADRSTYRPPGGENFEDLTRRGGAFLADAAAVPGARIAIIAHGFLNRALAGVLLSLDPVATLEIRQDNDTVIRIVETVGGPVARVVDHFRGPKGPLPGLPTVTSSDSRPGIRSPSSTWA